MILPLSSSHSSTTRPSRYGIRCLAIARRSLSLLPLKFKETFHWLQSVRSKVKCYATQLHIVFSMVYLFNKTILTKPLFEQSSPSFYFILSKQFYIHIYYNK